MKRFLKIGTTMMAAVFLVVFGVLGSADALTITPSTTPVWTSNVNSEPDVDDIYGYVNNTTSDAPDDWKIWYKAEVGTTVKEEGDFASSYATEFFNTPTDPKDATISWNGPNVISTTPLYLVVKDGKQTPAVYIFDLIALGWDGKAQLILNDFWPINGAISNVYIAGGSTPSVPEPATMLLLGTGLLGLGIISRRKVKK